MMKTQIPRVCVVRVCETDVALGLGIGPFPCVIAAFNFQGSGVFFAIRGVHGKVLLTQQWMGFGFQIFEDK